MTKIIHEKLLGNVVCSCISNIVFNHCNPEAILYLNSNSQNESILYLSSNSQNESILYLSSNSQNESILYLNSNSQNESILYLSSNSQNEATPSGNQILKKSRQSRLYQRFHEEWTEH